MKDPVKESAETALRWMREDAELWGYSEAFRLMHQACKGEVPFDDRVTAIDQDGEA